MSILSVVSIKLWYRRRKKSIPLYDARKQRSSNAAIAKKQSISNYFPAIQIQ
jgi:hypothetical protein